MTTDEPGGVWQSTNPSVATIDPATGEVAPKSAGYTQFRYTVNDATKSKAINVYANPTISPITGEGSVCTKSTITLATETVDPVWTSNNPSVAPVGRTTGVVSGKSDGTATITMSKTENGCTSSQQKDVEVIAIPTVGTISGPVNVCAGSAATYENATAGGTWATQNNQIVVIDPSTGEANFVGEGTTNILYTVDNGGCSKTVDKQITAKPAAATATFNIPASLCEVRITELVADIPGGVWSTLDPTIAKARNSTPGGATLLGVNPGSTVVFYTLNGGNGCKSVASDTINILDTPEFPIVTGDDEICLSETPLYAVIDPVNGTWMSSNPAVATIAQTGQLQPVSNGFMKVRYVAENGNGCTITSRPFSVTIEDANCGENKPAIAAINGTETAQISIYPNPATDAINIALPSAGTYSVSITDMLGRKMKQQTGNSQMQIALNIPSGIYQVVIASDGEIILREKIVKQ